MNKVLVFVYVPLIEECYEVFIPISKKIGTIVTLLKKSINELTDGYYPMTKDAYLFDKQRAVMYDNSVTVFKANIRNGTEIILM